MNCDDLKLRQVPLVIRQDTSELYLSDNMIMNLTSDDFAGCFNITLIDLTTNMLMFIHVNAFHDLTNLKHLMLSENDLKFDHKSYPPGVFARLSDLQTITLNNNFFYYPYSFESFQIIVKELPNSLRKIDIDIPCGDDFAYVLQRFKNLTEIGLFRDSQCKNVISNNSLYHLRKLPLTTLKIRIDNLTRVEPLAFSWFKDLTHLDLSKTFGMSINDLNSAWIGLERTKLAVLILSSFKQNPIDSDPVS